MTPLGAMTVTETEHEGSVDIGINIMDSADDNARNNDWSRRT